MRSTVLPRRHGAPGREFFAAARHFLVPSRILWFLSLTK
ncbi:hypothetical protein BVI1335_190008 [Burkholderia vietnamiensis]|nr:hypothetical protein BVI1335_190008 [Burkholderia vietnamiensis]